MPQGAADDERAKDGAGPGILDGLRVIDASAGLAGSVAALILAEAGAEVVKAELPGRGRAPDDARRVVWDRSKLGLGARGEAVLPALAELLPGADVLVHDLTPAEAEALGLDEATLQGRHPALVVCSVGGYPADHALRDLAVDDDIALAQAGVLAEQGAIRRDGPVYLRFPLGSWQAAYLAATGVLARLWAMRRGAPAGPVRTSLLQGALVTTQFFWVRARHDDPALNTGEPKHSLYSLCECSDGVWLHVMTPPDEVPAMKAGIARLTPEEIARATLERPPTPNIPGLPRNVLVFKTRPSTEWLPELRENDIAVMPAQPWGPLYSDEQVLANDLIVAVDDPVLGPTRQPAVPIEVSPPLRVRKPAPAPGEGPAPRWSPRPKPAAAAAAAPRAPLEGLKVLDFGNFLAGPLAASMMADLGADVIKVEQTTGDSMRYVAWAYMAANRNKRSLALQLKDPASRPVLEALVREADVVHHNLRMPAARRLGLDYESLRAINPDLVYCHVSAYGARGPQRDWPGYDQLFQAASGWEYEGAGEGNPPMWHRFGMMDHLCASASLAAVLLALLERDRTGQGQAVSASLLGASVLTLSETVLFPDGRTSPFARLDALQLGVSPQRRLYRCRDGWLALVAEREGAYAALLAAAGAADVGGLERAFAGLPLAEALALARGAGAQAAPARERQRDAFLDDPAHLASGLAAKLPHPAYGEFRQPGAFWSFGDLATRLDWAAPVLGQHTAEVLAEVGFGPAEREALARAGVIG